MHYDSLSATSAPMFAVERSTNDRLPIARSVESFVKAFSIANTFVEGAPMFQEADAFALLKVPP